MDLYVIPEHTPTTPEQLDTYRQHHDAGPHPDLRPLDGQPLAARLADLERQIRLFIDRYGLQPLCLRNHCIVWPGYTEMVDVLARCGIRMETNYTSGQYREGRQYAPYATFGGALPLRFGDADGRIIDVYQQPTHIMDDIWFAPDTGPFRQTTYSYRISAAAFEGICARIVDDMVNRLHTPVAVCIHPSNWVRFSAAQGQALVLHAHQRGVPVWSMTEWCRFWDTRDSWRCEHITWHEGVLQLRVSGPSDDRLRVQLPLTHGAHTLQRVCINEVETGWTRTVRYGTPVALVACPPGDSGWSFTATYVCAPRM
jgi:hypothetical protein